MKASFIFCLLFSNLVQANPTEIRVAILDTGFCPGLAQKNPNISIEPVVDVTQSNSYSCTKNMLSGPRFHGQRVMDIFSSIYTKEPGRLKVRITPVVIFDKLAKQRLSYWNKALELTKDHDLIISAAGLPLNSTKTSRLKQLKRASLPKVPTLLASGRISPKVSQQTKLFPQEFHAQENIFLFGAYHTPLFKNDFALEDKGLLYKRAITLYFPYAGKLHPELKGASRALAIGAAQTINRCPNFSGSSITKLRTCIVENSKQLKLKDKSRTLNTL